MIDQSQTVPARKAGIMEEAGAFLRSMPDKRVFVLMALAWTALFHFLGNATFGYVDTASIFKWAYLCYTGPNSEDEHGVLMPFAVLGLAWWKREELMAAPKRFWLPAIAGVLLGLLLHTFGYVVQLPVISIVAFFIGFYSLMGLAWGPGWLKCIFFPYILFVFAVPIARHTEIITNPLRMLATNVTVGICHWVLGINVIKDGVMLIDPNGRYFYEVAAACSGMRSTLALLALTTIFGFVNFKTPWKQWFFVLLALPLAVVGNVARLTAIVMSAEAFGRKAGNFVHEWFGFVTFAVAIGSVLILGHILREDDQPKGTAVETH
jgi:exosortase